MNKTDLIKVVAEKTNYTQKQVGEIISATFDTIKEALAEEDKVQLIGFGTFEVRDRQERKGKNPQTGEEIVIPATKVPAFKPGKELKETVKAANSPKKTRKK